MTDKILMDGEPLEVGNEVYCMLHGVGTVESINNESIFPIEIAFQHGCCTYTKNFRGLNNHKNRTLYWQRPEIIPPPKPRKKIKVWEWVSYCPNGFPLIIHRAMTEQAALDSGLNIKRIDGTEREVEI